MRIDYSNEKNCLRKLKEAVFVSSKSKQKSMFIVQLSVEIAITSLIIRLLAILFSIYLLIKCICLNRWVLSQISSPTIVSLHKSTAPQADYNDLDSFSSYYQLYTQLFLRVCLPFSDPGRLHGSSNCMVCALLLGVSVCACLSADLFN